MHNNNIMHIVRDVKRARIIQTVWICKWLEIERGEKNVVRMERCWSFCYNFTDSAVLYILVSTVVFLKNVDRPIQKGSFHCSEYVLFDMFFSHKFIWVKKILSPKLEIIIKRWKKSLKKFIKFGDSRKWLKLLAIDTVAINLIYFC